MSILTAEEKRGLIDLIEKSFANSKTFQLQIRTYLAHEDVGAGGPHAIIPKFKINYMKLNGNNWESFSTKNDRSLKRLLKQVPWFDIEELSKPDKKKKPMDAAIELVGAMDILGGDDEEEVVDQFEGLL